MLISLILLILANLSYADSPKDHAGWWLKNFGTVDRGNRDVARAEQIFRRVAEAADKKGGKLPRMNIIKSLGEPWVIAIRDGSIIVSEGAIATCFRNVSQAKGDARLAFILGHELSHLAKDDYWHIAAFDALVGYKGEKGNESRIKSEIIALLEKWGDIKPGQNANEVIRTKELQADEEGLLTMTMAGFEPSLIVGDHTNFFEEWISLITGRSAYNDVTHPSPPQRALFVKAQMKPVIDAL
ncbi:MAG: M48 family metalloprotease, partial [Pedobacter sp.]